MTDSAQKFRKGRANQYYNNYQFILLYVNSEQQMFPFLVLLLSLLLATCSCGCCCCCFIFNQFIFIYTFNSIYFVIAVDDIKRS